MENLDQLKERDFTIIVDRSGSMSKVDTRSGKTRWKAVEESVESAARKLTELDSDGITVYAFSDRFQRFDNTTADKVEEIFKGEPNGSTNLAACLNHAFTDYLGRKAKSQTKLNGECMVVVTDGEPDSEADVSKEIVNVTKRLDSAKELSLIFLQVGDDPKATKFLNALDDELTKKGAKYDIVSTIPVDKLGDRPLTDVLLDAITEAKIH